MIWEVVSSIAAAVSVIIAVITYGIDSRNKKRADTINAIDHVFESYYKLPKNREYLEYVKFMSIVERFATDANEKVLKKSLIKKRLSIFLIEEYEKSMKDIITQRRKQFNRDSYYSQIEELISYLKK